MANLQFTDLQNEVFAHVGIDSTDSTNQTNVKRWINYVQQDICARWAWAFMQNRESIVTVPDYTTGTVSINSGSSTVTGSGTTFTAVQGGNDYFIQFAGSNDWYNINLFTSTTSLGLERGYAGTTNLTNVAFIIRKFFYSLSSACDRIYDIRNWGTPMKLIQVDARTIDDIRPNPQSTNTPYGYMTWMYDSQGNLQISPYPYPSDSREFDVRTIMRPVDMVNGTDAPSIPNKYAHVIAWGAISVGFAYLRNFDAANAWNAKVEGRLAQMKMEYRMSEDNQMIMRSIDSIQRTKWQSLPEQYPVITG